MKRKLFLVMCLVGVLMFSACGDDGTTSNDPDIPTRTTTPSVTEDPYEYDYEEEWSSGEWSDEDWWEYEEENGEYWSGEEASVDPTEEPTPEPEPEPEITSGIYVFAQRYPNTGMFEVEVHIVDPETAKTSLVQSFSAKNAKNNLGAEIYYPGYYNYPAVSADASKLAVTLYYPDDSAFHAGWIDEDGNVFDVTVALDWQYHGGFSEKKINYQGCGFMPGTNDFVFCRNNNADPYYVVPADDLMPAAIQEYEKSPIRLGAGMFITDQISDNRYLVEDGHSIATDLNSPNHREVAIYDTTTKKTTYFLPDSARCNYSGVLNPDGTLVAFLSELESVGTHKRKCTTVYISSIDDGEPWLLSEDVLGTAGEGWELKLLDWR